MTLRFHRKGDVFLSTWHICWSVEGQNWVKVSGNSLVKTNKSPLLGFMLHNLTCISCVSWVLKTPGDYFDLQPCTSWQADKLTSWQGPPAQVPASQLVLFCNGKLLQVGFLALRWNSLLVIQTNYRHDKTCCSRKRMRRLSGKPEFAVGARYWRAGLSVWLSLSIWFHLNTQGWSSEAINRPTFEHRGGVGPGGAGEEGGDQAGDGGQGEGGWAGGKVGQSTRSLCTSSRIICLIVYDRG